MLNQKLLLILCVAVTLSSCATVFSGEEYIMNISSDLPNASVVINQSDIHYQTPAKIVVARSKEKLNLQVLQNDSVIRDTIIKPRLSDAFWFGNLYPFGYGWLIDLTTEKRFTYGKNLHIDAFGNIHSVRYFSQRKADLHWQKYKKGSANLLFSIPEVNFFHLSPKEETPRNLGGFLGIGLGAEYFYENNRSLQLRGDAIMNFIAPFPAPFDWDETAPWESCYAYNIHLTDNIQIKRVQLGYGLNFARNTWVNHGYYAVPYEERIEGEEPEWIEGKSNTRNLTGLSFQTYYRLTNHFYAGVIYRPSFLELSKKPKWTYEHSISLDLMWKIGK